MNLKYIKESDVVWIKSIHERKAAPTKCMVIKVAKLWMTVQTESGQQIRISIVGNYSSDVQGQYFICDAPNLNPVWEVRIINEKVCYISNKPSLLDLDQLVIKYGGSRCELSPALRNEILCQKGAMLDDSEQSVEEYFRKQREFNQ